MFVKRLKAVTAALVCAAVWAALTSTAQASLLTVTTTGTTSGGSVAGSAEFEIDSANKILEVTLTNTTSGIGSIAQVFDGLSFTLTGGSGFLLTSVTAAGFLDCTTGSCTSVLAFQEYPGNPNLPPVTVGSPYDWILSGGLFAGNGSLKPGGIVNGTIDGSLDGLRNREHNDYLFGPVVFDISFITAPTAVSDVTFWWGTGRETTPGNIEGCTQEPCVLPQPTIPEPGSIALVGLALSGLAWARRRFKT